MQTQSAPEPETGLDRRAQYNEAIAECARSLLASRGAGRLERALVALLTATEATYVFLERNVDDPVLGFCSQTVIEVEVDNGRVIDETNEYWRLVPWEKMPTSRAYLERGEPFLLIPAELEGVEYELYAADPYPVQSELDIPIFVHGEWAGLIGFADEETIRYWTPTDISLLTAAASMIGAFWERAADRESLERALSAKDEFLASVSHELRTPLTSVVAIAEELADHLDDFPRSAVDEMLDILRSESRDMSHLIEDLLVAARAESGHLHIDAEVVDLSAEVRTVADQLGIAVFERNGQLVLAWADQHRVRQIMRNLLSNAARYGGDQIEVAVGGTNNEARLTVADNGAGVDQAMAHKIFDRYERAHDRPGLPQAVGLGLAVSRQLAILMGGDLSYTRVDGWTKFALELPRAT